MLHFLKTYDIMIKVKLHHFFFSICSILISILYFLFFAKRKFTEKNF